MDLTDLVSCVFIDTLPKFLIIYEKMCSFRKSRITRFPMNKLKVRKDRLFALNSLSIPKIPLLLVYKEAFLMYDKNGDSKITLDEFGDVIKNLGLTPSEEQLAKLMQEIDLDGIFFSFLSSLVIIQFWRR